MKRLGFTFALVVALVGASNQAAAQPSFAGTWKLNLAKSQMAGQTLSVEKTASGSMHFDIHQGFGFDFDLSGKEFPTPDGGTTSWREINPTTWEGTNKFNGKVFSVFRMTLNGETINAVVKTTQPEGKAVEQSSSWSRVSGGPGFFGEWKSTEMKGAPLTLEIALEGANGITVRYPEFQAACKGSFDGKDYPWNGAGANLKQTLAFEKSGANSIKMTTKLDGKPFYVEVLTLSADGKTLTDDGTPVSAKEPTKAVYEKQ
jgi:hypothetical protein